MYTNKNKIKILFDPPDTVKNAKSVPNSTIIEQNPRALLGLKNIGEGLDFPGYKNPKAVEGTLQLLMKDDMYSQSRKEEIKEMLRGWGSFVTRKEDNRTKELFEIQAIKAIELAEKTGEVQAVVYNRNEGFIIYSREALRKNAFSKPEETNTTLFKRILSDENYKKVLEDTFGRHGLEAIGLYILSRGRKSALIDGLPEEKIGYIVSFGEKVNEKLKKLGSISIDDLPVAKETLKKLGKNIDIKFNEKGDFDFIETFGGKGLSPLELNTMSKALFTDYDGLHRKSEAGQKRSIDNLSNLGMKGYDDISTYYKKKGAKNTELLVTLENIKLTVPLKENEAGNIILFLEQNPQLRNDEVSKNLTDLISAQLRRGISAGGKAVSNAVAQKTENPKTEAAKKFATNIQNKDKAIAEVLRSTSRIGQSIDVQNQLKSSTLADSEMREIISRMGIGNIDTVMSDPEKGAMAIAILSSKGVLTVQERRLLHILSRSEQEQRKIAEDIVTIRRSLPPEERRDTAIYVSSAFERTVSNKEIEQYAYASRYHYGNEGEISLYERKIAEMRVGSSMKLSGAILPPQNGENGNARETLSNITLFAPEMNKRTILYDGNILATLPIEHIEGYIQSISDCSFLGMNQLLPQLGHIQASITKHTRNRLSGTDGDYSTNEHIRFLQVMNLICFDRLPDASHDVSILRRPFMQTHGKSIIANFESLMSTTKTQNGTPLWNRESRTINLSAFDMKIGEFSDKIAKA